MATTRRKAVPNRTTSIYTAAVSTPRRYVAPEFVGNPFDAAAIADHHDAVAAAPWLAGVATPTPLAAPSQRLRVLCVIPEVEADSEVLDKIDDMLDAGDVNGETARALDRRRLVAELRLHERLMAYIGEGSLCPEIVLDRVTDSDDVRGLEVEVADRIVGTRQLTRTANAADYDLVFVDEGQHGIIGALPSSRLAIVGGLGAGKRGCSHHVHATISALLRRIGDEVEQRRAQMTMPWAAPLPTVPAPSLDDAEVDAMVMSL